MANYGNYRNLRPDSLVGCAREQNREHAEAVFLSSCPSEYTVDEIFPFPNKTKPYCRWLLKYCRLDGGPVPQLGDELKRTFNMLMRFPPQDCNVFSKHYVDQHCLMIVYSVKCDCNTSLYFESATPPPTLWPIKKEENEFEVEFCFDKFFYENID